MWSADGEEEGWGGGVMWDLGRERWLGVKSDTVTA